MSKYDTARNLPNTGSGAGTGAEAEPEPEAQHTQGAWPHASSKSTEVWAGADSSFTVAGYNAWKPLWFWLGSLNFWDGGLALQSCHLMVPELEQPSARPARSAGRKNQSIFILFCQKWKIGSGRDLGSDLVSAEGGSYRGPTPKRKHP